MEEPVIYRHFMDRAPTIGERTSMLGFCEYQDALRKRGWVDSDNEIKRDFVSESRVFYFGKSGNCYIEWIGFLDE